MRAAATHQFKFFETPPGPLIILDGVVEQRRNYEFGTFRATASAALRTAIHSFAISLLLGRELINAQP
jgi:hypothetical protein